MWANLKGNTITNVMQLWQNTVIQITELRETLRDTKYRWLLKSIEPLMKLLFLKHPDFLSLHLKMTPSFGRWGTGERWTEHRPQQRIWQAIRLFYELIFSIKQVYFQIILQLFCVFIFLSLVVDLGWHWRDQPIKMDVVTEKSDEDDDDSLTPSVTITSNA